MAKLDGLVSARLKKKLYYLAFAQAVVATGGSLYFSEVLKFVPCTLCWYQRILMYPLVLVIAVGIIRKDRRLWQYVLPISGLGFLVALYHNLIYYKVLPEFAFSCRLGVPCTTRYIFWLGFLSIPLLSLAAFTIISACMLGYKLTDKQ